MSFCEICLFNCLTIARTGYYNWFKRSKNCRGMGRKRDQRGASWSELASSLVENKSNWNYPKWIICKWDSFLSVSATGNCINSMAMPGVAQVLKSGRVRKSRRVCSAGTTETPDFCFLWEAFIFSQGRVITVFNIGNNLLVMIVSSLGLWNANFGLDLLWHQRYRWLPFENQFLLVGTGCWDLGGILAFPWRWMLGARVVNFLLFHRELLMASVPLPCLWFEIQCKDVGCSLPAPDRVVWVRDCK